MSDNNPCVIIVDDELYIRKLIRKVVESINFKVVAEASNGLEAIVAYKTHKPNLMFMDINMPFKTGLEALQDIIEINPDANIIMLSSASDTDTVNKTVNIGAIGFIRKDTPVDKMKSIILDTWNDINSGDE